MATHVLPLTICCFKFPFIFIGVSANNSRSGALIFIRVVIEREKYERILFSLSLPTYSLSTYFFIVFFVFILCFSTPSIFLFTRVSINNSRIGGGGHTYQPLIFTVVSANNPCAKTTHIHKGERQELTLRDRSYSQRWAPITHALGVGDTYMALIIYCFKFSLIFTRESANNSRIGRTNPTVSTRGWYVWGCVWSCLSAVSNFRSYYRHHIH